MATKARKDSQNTNVTPEVISEFNELQQAYVTELIAAMTRVVHGTSTLEAEERKAFGEGRFFWPKNPSASVKLLRYFPPENFRIKGITLSFHRISETSPWTKTVISISPRSLPFGGYNMNIPHAVFSDYQLEKTELSVRPDEQLQRINVFHYHKKNNKKIMMTIECSEKLSSLKETYPSSFYVIYFKKTD